MPEESATAAVRRFVDAVNEGRIDEALAMLAPDATIVEDIAPFRWTGAGAGEQWLAAMMANAAELGVTSVVMDIAEPLRAERSGDHAYAVYPGLLLMRGEGVKLDATGTLTFALTAQGGRWLVSALAWSGTKPGAA